MQFLPGSIREDNEPIFELVWRMLEDAETLNSDNGICVYKGPPVRTRDRSQLPTFTVLSQTLGVVLIDIVREHVLEAREDDYWRLADGTIVEARDVVLDNYAGEIANRFRKDSLLFDRRSRSPTIPIRQVLVFYANADRPEGRLLADHVLVKQELDGGANALLPAQPMENPISEEVLSRALSSLDGTNVYGAPKLPDVDETPATKSSLVRKALAITFQLDSVQRQIAYQLPPGPQRIRGLAGTGKTVILSMKAALAHYSQPDFRILFLFNTRSMYGQIRKRITDYFIQEASAEPDWDRIEILHAWGGREQAGLYSSLCDSLGLQATPFRQVRQAPDPLEHIFDALLKSSRERLRPQYDIVLIDEAQDFGPKLFETVYYLTKSPKRIVWAYDEFQSLGELKIREPEELFGEGPDGRPNMPNSVLSGEYARGTPKDYILPNSYRNPRITLMVAHGLAMGLYRPSGVIDVLDDRRAWEALGYRILAPDKARFEEGDELQIVRPRENSRNVLEELVEQSTLTEHDLVETESFDSNEKELETLVADIEDLVNFHAVDPRQIIVIALDSRTAKKQFAFVRRRLDQRGMKAITPGFIESADTFQIEGRVTLTTTFRAKGNEGHFVFVLNAEKAAKDYSLRSRNELFVSITRALGWCKITGVGADFERLLEEIGAIKRDYPRFAFRFPSVDDLQRRRRLLQLDDAKVNRQMQELDQIAEENPDLFLERIRSDPRLLEQIRRNLDEK